MQNNYPLIKTVIFDMDGVLVDTEPIHRAAYRQHFRELKIEVSNEMYAGFTGNSTKNIYQRLKHAFNLTAEVQDLVNRKRQLFDQEFSSSSSLEMLPGVKRLIEDLHNEGVQMVLASSSAKVSIDKIFDKFQLNSYFTYKVSGEDFEQSKPNPAIFIEAARLSKTDVSECVVIEDSTNGIKAANAAGIFCIGYQSENSMGQSYELADYILDDFYKISAQKVKLIKNIG